MKIISLLSLAYVGGILRSPADGPVEATDDEAASLVPDKAVDVTADFPNGLQPPPEAAPAKPAKAAD